MQLEGSVFLFRRSNFYRFAPEIGLADSLATLALVGKALIRGYRWKESVAAVLLVREGVGSGELWWREGSEVGSNGGTQSVASLLVDASNEDGQANESDPTADINQTPADASGREQHSQHEDRWTTKLMTCMRPYANPVSAERVIGTSLFIISLTKTLAILATTPDSPAIRLAAFIALAYSFSFIVFEVLVWSLAFVSPGYSLMHVPVENFLELLRMVDPGDNPFTFSNLGSPAEDSEANLELEMHSMSTQARGYTDSSSVPWNKAVAICAASSLLFGPFLWVFLLKSIWSSNKIVFYLSISALVFFAVRLSWKLALKRGQTSIYRNFSRMFLARKLLRGAEARPYLFAIRWVFERVNTVNTFSALWLGVILLFYVGSFGQYSGKEENNPLLKPMWLDWLG